MAWGNETAPGVPLAHYRQHGAGVRLTCRDCQLHRDLPLEAVLARLAARGVDGERLGIRALARLVTRPCGRCGGRRFVTTPAFPARALDPATLPPSAAGGPAST